MSTSDRLDKIEQDNQSQLSRDVVEHELKFEGFDMGEGYPEYGHTDLVQAYRAGHENSHAHVPDLLAAVRAVLDACDRIDASIIPSGDFEVGQKSVTQTVRMVVEHKLSTVPSAADSARAIATALGEGTP